jgi:hypothetical protein
LQFEGDFKDAVVQMYGSRPVKAAVESMKIDALMELKAARDEAINAELKGDTEARAKFNALWPDLAITNRDISDRKKSRERNVGESTYERMSKSTDKTIRKFLEQGAGQ